MTWTKKNNKRLMDICILAGGLGTRLKGVWDGPKCMAPIAGRPLLHWLIDEVMPLKPRLIVLALGHRANDVVSNLPPDPIDAPLPIGLVFEDVENNKLGTAGALRNAIMMAKMQAPILVMNGDTIPCYNLRHLGEMKYKPITAAWCQRQYAGAAFLNARGVELILQSTASDLDDIIHLNNPDVLSCELGGFVDIGTPERFAAAQQLKVKV